MLCKLILVVFLSTVTAWPTAVFEEASLIYNATDEDITANLEKAYKLLKIAPRQLSFNPSNQYVPTTGKYAFQPPNYAAGDQRGNCPGLNALANHGYIPRNGVATATQFANAVYQVYGMGLDAGIFLGTFGSVMTGDLTKFSIGGPTPYVPGLGLGLLGTPQGISSNSSHSKYEGDASSTRGDLFLLGDSSRLQMSYFTQLFDMQPDPATANYNMKIIIPYHANRFRHSVMNNRYFFNSPLAGLIGVNAAHNFVPRLFANHSQEYPDGILNQEVLKSFFAVSGPRSNFVYKHGWERIPDNWYRRSTGYTLVHAAADIVASASVYPPFLSVGGNLGQVNTFTGVSLGALTGGTFNAAGLLQGNNAICFALQTARFATPDVTVGPDGILSGGGLLGSGGLLGGLLNPVLSPVLTPVINAVNNLVGVVTNILSGLSCPDLRTYDKTVFDRFPGAIRV